MNSNQQDLELIQRLFKEKALAYGASYDDSTHQDARGGGLVYHSPGKGHTVFKGMFLNKGYDDPPTYEFFVYASSYHPIRQLLSMLPFFGTRLKRPKFLGWREEVATFKELPDHQTLDKMIDQAFAKLEKIDREFLKKNAQTVR